MKGSHSEFIGDKVEQAIETIAEESDEVTEWELLSAYADGDLEPDLYLEGNYLRVSVDWGADDAE